MGEKGLGKISNMEQKGLGTLKVHTDQKRLKKQIWMRKGQEILNMVEKWFGYLNLNMAQNQSGTILNMDEKLLGKMTKYGLERVQQLETKHG